MELIIDFLPIIFLVIISVYISMTEIAFAAARDVRIRALADAGDKRAKRVMGLRDDASRVITALQITTNAVAILAGIVGNGALQPYLYRFFIYLGVGEYSDPAAATVAFVIITSLFVLFGDLIPRRVAMRIPEQIVLAVSWFPYYSVKLLGPLVWIFKKLSDWFIDALKLPSVSEISQVTTEDFKMVLEEGAESGALNESEHVLIENVLTLEKRYVTSIMTLRDDVVFIDVKEPLEVNIEKVQNAPFSRYPLCDGGIDNIIGVVRAEDVMIRAMKGVTDIDFVHTRRDILAVPETLNVWEVMAEFDAHSSGFAAVVSEYGLVVGVVSFKDLLGVLVHGIANPFEEDIILQRDDGSYLIDGMASFVDVFRELGLSTSDDDGSFETIGGFMVSRLRRAARKGDKVKEQGFIFEVVDADRIRLNQLLVTKRPVSTN